MQTYVHGQYDQAHHSGKDSLGRSLLTGRRYLLSQPGAKSIRVTITEDESTGDQCFSLEDGSGQQRVEECAIDCTLSLVIDDGHVSDSLMTVVASLLAEAHGSRAQLTSIETRLCQQLGCQPGDGSETWDAISSAVRDGLGTAFDLAQLGQVSA